MNITMVSESEFGIQGQGVHTAYRELVASLNKRPDIEVKTNDFRSPADITHIHTVGPYSLFFLLFGKGKKVVSVHVVPASFVGSLAGAKLWLPLARLYLKWFYGKADCLCAVSKKVADELHHDMKLKTRVEVTYNTVDMSQYAVTAQRKKAARRKLSINSDQFVVLGLGQVQPRKRVDRFVEVARGSTALFIWVGGIPFKKLGADHDAMTELMQQPPANVRFPGIIDHSKVSDYLAAAEAFFLPAEQENHPMCVLEAAGAGLPVLLNDISEYDDTFRPNAIFVRTAADAIDAVKRLQFDPNYYDKYRQKSALIAQRFDSAAGAERTASLYHSLLNR